MSSKYITEILTMYLKRGNSRIVSRRNREMRERVSMTADFKRLEVADIPCRQEEYDQYVEMVKDQFPRFNKYLQQDRFSRRLMIQFPVSWYDDKQEDYMPCPESFLVLYQKGGEKYDVIFNERSTEVNRAAEDIAIVYKICTKELNLPGEMDSIYIHYMNAHEYLDGGSSEDFDVKKGYFDRK